MSDVKLTPFPGIDNVTQEPNAVPGALRDALNVDVDRMGQLTSRAGVMQVQPGAAASAFSSTVLNRVLFASNGQLMAYDAYEDSSTSLGAVADDELEMVEVNNEVVVGGMNTLAVVRNGVLVNLGVEHPAPPIVQATDDGGFAAGRYGVCLTFVADTGEESAASDALFFDVPENGGLDVVAVPVPLEAKVKRIRIYRTTANGDLFYLSAETGLAPGLFALNPAQLGRACDTRHMTRMRPGRHLRYWRGRVLVSRGRNIYFSEPMRYGLIDVRHGFIQLPATCAFIEPVEGGVYVGQPDGVLFLKGTTPAELAAVVTGAATPLSGSSTKIDPGEMTGDFVNSSMKYAVWFGERGYALGGPDGSVVEPQSKRLLVPVGQRGTTVVHQRRLTTLVH